MAKQIIRLTESDLHRIIKESVKRIIKEDWHDELSSIYDAGKKEDSAGIDLDKASSILKNLKRQYGSDKEGYSRAVNKFFSDREKRDDFEKAKRDPAFELWSDEHESTFNDEGYPMAKDFEPLPFNRERYNKRIKNGEMPRALRRSYSSGPQEVPETPSVNSPYKGKSSEEIEQMMRDMGFAK